MSETSEGSGNRSRHGGTLIDERPPPMPAGHKQYRITDTIGECDLDVKVTGPSDDAEEIHEHLFEAAKELVDDGA